jgi:hypothetical protein
MKKTKNILMTEFFGFIAVVFILVLLFENDILDNGVFATEKNAEFLIVSFMELITIATIPVVMRLFKFKKISRALTSDEACAPGKLLFWGTFRIVCFGLPLVVNTILYYLFMNVAFGYMAIILLICMPFIYPSMDRCISETTK